MTNAGNSFENDGLPLSFQHRRVRERELWLAMQEAHKRWTHATEVLNSITFSVAGEEVSPEESVRIAKAAEEQRLGFEEYIEARLEFSEFLLAREPEAGHGAGAGGGIEKTASSLRPKLVEFREHVETRPGGAGARAAVPGGVRPDFYARAEACPRTGGGARCHGRDDGPGTQQPGIRAQAGCPHARL